MGVRMAGSSAHLERVQSIPDVADYIDSLVISGDEKDATFQSSDILTRATTVCDSNRKPTISVSVCPDQCCNGE